VAKISQPININIGASDLVFAGISIIIFIVWEYQTDPESLIRWTTCKQMPWKRSTLKH